MLKLIPGVQYSENSVLGPSAGGSGVDNKYGFDGIDVSLPLFGNLAADPSTHDVENVAMAHPAVAMAACVGIFHPKWDERPIVCVVKKPGAEVSREELLAFYEGKTAKWQIPDDVVFVDAIPLGATGKMQKTKLRETLKDYQLPTL